MVVVLAGACGRWIDAPYGTFDIEYFLRASDVLLSGRWLTAFADPGLQAGPWQVGGIGAAAKLGRLVGSTGLTGVAVAQSVALAAAVFLASLSVVRGPSRHVISAGAVAVLLVNSTIHTAFFYGHPAEVAVPCVWVLAGCAALRGRSGLAGVLIGFSAGFETWGVLGAPVLVLDPRVRQLVRGAAACALTLAVTYGPFMLHGPFRMFDYRWDVAPNTLPALLGDHSTFTWWMRLAQGAAALAAGLIVARLLRRHPWAACWAIPLAIASTKVLTDPVRAPWYLVAPQTLAVIGAAQLLTSSRPADELARRGRNLPGRARAA